MTVPYEVTGNDMSRLFIPEGECNGQGSRHVVDGYLIRVMPCKCETCEAGKPAREKAYISFEERMIEARRRLDERKKTKLENYRTD